MASTTTPQSPVVAEDVRPKTDKTITMVDTQPQRVLENVFTIRARLHVFPGVTFPLRMTILRNPSDETLTIYNPLNPALYADLSPLGTVTAIIAPAAMHSTYAQSAKQHYASATLFSSPGLKERFPDRDWGTLVTADSPENCIATHLRVKLVAPSPNMKELIVLHETSGTLLCADLAFNLTENCMQDASWLVRLYIRITGSNSPLNVGSTLHAMYRRHCADLLPALDHILQWEWSNAVPAHGDVVEGNAKTLFKEGIYKFVSDTAAKQRSQA